MALTDENAKSKSDLLKIVNEGIEYAFTDAPKQLSFLDGVVLPFILKLPLPDILEINAGISDRVEDFEEDSDMDKDPCDWLPHDTSVSALQDMMISLQSIQGSDDEEDSDQEWMSSGEDEFGAMFRWCGDCVDDEVCKSCGRKNGCPPDYKGPMPVDGCPF